MKEPFKHLTILAFHKDRAHITSQLQNLGVIHLELDETLHNHSVEQLEIEKNRLEKAIETLRSHAKDFPAKESPTAPPMEREQVVEEVLHLRHQSDEQIQRRETLTKESLRLAPWGDFGLDKISALAANGINITFCIADKKAYKKYDFSELVQEIVHEGPDKVYFIVVALDDVPDLPFETVKMPTLRLSEIERQKKSSAQNATQIASDIGKYVSYLPELVRELRKVEDQLVFQFAMGSYQEHGLGALISLTGWYPASVEGRLLHVIGKENLTYSISEPSEGDDVPVLLHNPKYPKLFEPITRIFELPNYREMDLTPFIAVFYPILFAYCLGDAGYGFILLAAAVIGGFTFLRDMRNIAILGVILGFFTTVMGLVKSGSVFGQPTTLSDLPFFQYLAQYVVIPDDRSYVFNAFNVALMIGVVQILVGIVVSIINKLQNDGFIHSLSQIGKLLIVTSLIWIFLADMQGVEALAGMPLLRKVALLLGLGLVLFFHDMTVSVGKRAASAILPLFFIMTGILGDILSYVRLFALGVASSVLGLVVNQIGAQIMGNGWWGIAIGVVFLLFGHSLNFGIAMLGAFVHPLRLTFVEFYNNAQFTGGGVEYKPFRKQLKNIDE